MMEPGRRSLMVSGNVYFCDFRRTGTRSAIVPLLRPVSTPRDVCMTAETLQGACRDLMAGAPVLVRRAELNVADLVSIAGMIDEMAFQVRVHLLGADREDNGPCSTDELQRILLDAAAITAEIQLCMSDVVCAVENLRERLHAQAVRALQLGRSVTDALGAAPQDQDPASG
jgi:hypothetical protein